MIPVRNDEARLRRCLTSIIENAYPRHLVEIIVVDNGSTDGSAAAAAELGATVLHLPNTRVAGLRNQGAQASTGEIIAFVDADHEIDRQWLATATEVLSSPEIVATGSAYLPEPAANWVQQQYDGLRVRPRQREEVDWLGSGNLAVKRLPFEMIGGFDAALTACEDVDLCNRLRQAGHRIVADPGLRSVHFGDPRTLKALFYGELWRGRDNFKVTLRGPRTFRHLRSLIVPIADLVALAAGVIALLLGYPLIALGLWLVPLVPAAIKASFIVRNRPRPTLTTAAQAMVVAVLFDLARALALLVGGSHRARRSS